MGCPVESAALRVAAGQCDPRLEAAKGARAELPRVAKGARAEQQLRSTEAELHKRDQTIRALELQLKADNLISILCTRRDYTCQDIARRALARVPKEARSETLEGEDEGEPAASLRRVIDPHLSPKGQ